MDKCKPLLAGECPMVEGRDTWWHDEVAAVDAECECEWVESEAPLFMLYTSGSTGTPKAGPARYSSPCQPTHFHLSLLDLNGIL